MQVRIENARLYDPALGLSGEEGEVCLRGNRIVESVASPDLVVDAKRGAALPGGIDLSSAAGSPLAAPMTAAGSLDPLSAQAEHYLEMGYTHVNARPVPLWAAGAAHYWLSRMAPLDFSLEALLNLRDIDSLIKDDEGAEKGAAHAAFLIEAGGAMGLSVAEPFVRYREDYLSFRQVEAKECLQYLARLAGTLGLKVSVAFSERLSESLPRGAAELFHLAGVPGKAAAGLKDFFQRGGTADLVMGEGEQGLALDAGLFAPLAPKRQEPYFTEGFSVALAGVLAGGGEAALEEFSREFGPEAFTLATRTVPARGLGLLPEKGTLAPGALADVAVFEPEGSLTRCRHLFKSGVLVLEEGRPTGAAPEMFTYVLSPEVEPGAWGVLPGSFRRENLGVRMNRLASAREVTRDVRG